MVAPRFTYETGEPQKTPKKGDLVRFTFKGHLVKGRVLRLLKRNGCLLVDVLDHPDADVGWVDVRPSPDVQVIDP